MVRIDISYDGDLRCRAVHAPSGRTVDTDAPVDNQGRAESFSPTDLLATGLGTCMITTMGILAKQRAWDLAGTTVTVVKHMTPPPRRVARLVAELSVPEKCASALDAAAREALEEKANTCPVRMSLLPAIDVPVTFHWGSP